MALALVAQADAGADGKAERRRATFELRGGEFSLSELTLSITRQGPMVGTEEELPNGKRMRAFRGVPYARPPVDERRFKAPQPPARHKGILDATAFGNACQQPASEVFAIQNTNPELGVSEDCLYLNVFTPSRSGLLAHIFGKQRPVMVWLHGGGLTTGAGPQSGGNPERLVQEGVVVVSINYRLGVLGYLAHPALSTTADTPGGGSGNYGLMDQIRALEWVQNNIAFFGGDPDNVTVFGESAGGFSVKGLMGANDNTAGLFHRAIIQSGPIRGPQETQDQAESRGGAFLSDLCPSEATEAAAECLRNLSVEEILSAQVGPPEFNTSIIRRPGVLEQNITDALASGQFTGEQVLEGTNLDEWRLFVAAEQLLTGRPSLESLIGDDTAAYRAELIDRYGFVTEANADLVVSLYPLSDFATADIAVSAVGTDPIFACPALANVSATSQHVPTFAYEFADRGAPELFTVGPDLPLGAAHAAEIQYILDPASAVDESFTADSATLADAMVRYWASFARNGDPTPAGGDLPFWGTFPSQGYQSLEAPTPTSPAGVDSNHNCSSFWLAG